MPDTPIRDKTEILTLTSLRGFAAIMVVFYHFRNEFGNTLNIDYYTGYFYKGYMWVDFFFILSGFVISFKYYNNFYLTKCRADVATFLIKRLARIYPLHLTMLFLFLPMEVLKLALQSHAAPAFSINSFPAVLTNLLLMQAWHLHHSVTWNHPAWSISAEWAAYLLFPLLVPLVLRAGRLASWALAAGLLSGITWLTLVAGHGELSSVMPDFGAVRGVLGFTLGMQIYRLWRSNSPQGLRAWAGSGLSLATALIAVGAALHFKAFDPLIILLFCWLTLAASGGESALHRLISIGPMHYLGIISYSIYMDHAFVQHVWRFIWQRWADGVYGTTASLATLALLLAGILALSSLTYRFIECPGRVALPRWFARLVPPIAAKGGGEAPSALRPVSDRPS